MRAALSPMLALIGLSLAPTLVSAQEGQVLWRFQMSGNAPGKFVGVAADGRVYTTNFDPADIYALRPDGSLLWSLNLGLASGMWPISFAADGTIYTGAVGVRAVNPDGTLRWAFDPGSWIISGPSVGPDGNLYAADNVNTGGIGYFSLDPDGTPRWSNPADPAVFGLYDPGLDEIVFGGDRLFGGIHFPRSGPWINTYAFDSSGEQLWNRYYTSGGGPSSNPRLLPDGRLVFRWGQGSLAALHQDGTDDWVVPHPDGAQVLVTPAIGPDGAIYSGDEYGVQLWSANPDGSTRWVNGADTDEYLAAEGLGVSPDNRVLVAGGWTYSQADGMNHGWVRGYGTVDGRLLWQVDLAPEQGRPQFTRTVRPAFSPNGDTVYLTTWFASSGVGHSYLYAIALREITVGVPADGRDKPKGPVVSCSPNPSLGSARILLVPGKPGVASVTVYDAAGRTVSRLFEGPVVDQEIRLVWDLRDEMDRAVAPGVYFVSARTAAGTSTTRIVVAR